jgi:hypothetical protein
MQRHWFWVEEDECVKKGSRSKKYFFMVGAGQVIHGQSSCF